MKRTEMPSTGADAVEGYFLDSVSANAPDALCGRVAAFAALLLAEEADFAVLRLFHCCQRNYLQAHPTQCFSAGLEALLNADTRTDGVALRLTANVHQAFERFAVGKEIINQQHTLSLFQTTLADVDGAGRLVGKGEHISGIHIVAKVAALTLLAMMTGRSPIASAVVMAKMMPLASTVRMQSIWSLRKASANA